MIPDYPTIIILSICGLYIYAMNLIMETTIICVTFYTGMLEDASFTQPNSNNRFQNTPRFLLVPCVC